YSTTTPSATRTANLPVFSVFLVVTTVLGGGGGGGGGGGVWIPLQAQAYATGAGPGGGPQVNGYSASGTLLNAFFAYDPGFTGGVRVAVGDSNGDGIPDLLTAPGPGGGPNLRAFDGKTGAILRNFFAFDPNFTGGLYIAAGDVTGDGVADILVGADTGG